MLNNIVIDVLQKKELASTKYDDFIYRKMENQY